MGRETFIDWISPEIALAYFLATTVVMVGVLQIAGAGWDRLDLRWPRSRPLALLLGAILIAAATTTFYVTMHSLIFVPGLAGTELLVLFGLSTLLATIIVRLAALGVHRRRTPGADPTTRLEEDAPVPESTALSPLMKAGTGRHSVVIAENGLGKHDHGELTRGTTEGEKIESAPSVLTADSEPL